ncbi:MAG: UDP-glucose 6-dehydrogenase [Candidatus Cloacimonetes bacterium 4572_55]|nr:MAG: UDP-glucose 6-dehydrogenase [Candidatus Cloacimonetes bacterium 4572_55]
MKHITVFGAGYVGLVTGAGLSDFGNRVICVDVDKNKIDGLNLGIIPIYEPGLKDLVDRNKRANRLTFTTDIVNSITKAEVIFIAVGTPPTSDGQANLQFVEEVARNIAEHAKGYKVIVTKSTVPVGTGQLIEKILSETAVDLEFDVVSNPEFLREGSAIEDFMRPNRVVIGSRTERAAKVMKDVYRSLYINETPIITTDVESAEIIKYASNAFLATKITFINEIANLCEKVGADVHHVAKGMGSDHRIGKKFLHPGPGYGGSCFPKDTSALVKIAHQFGENIRIVETVMEVNEAQKRRITDKILSMMGGDVRGKTIGVLGLAFKPNTDDMRESAALTVLPLLIDKGAKIKAFDRVAAKNARALLPDSVEYCKNSYETAEGADALVILTEWNEFRELNLERIKSLLKEPVIIDCRNLYDPSMMEELGFCYDCLGRGSKRDLHR